MHFPPFLFAAIRQLTAGLLLSGFMLLIRNEKFPSLSTLRFQVFRGFLMFTLGNGLVSWAELFVSSGLAAIICSTMPVMVILINLSINKNERPTWVITLGSITGLAGIILVFSEFLSDFINPNYSVGVLLIFTATLTWALGSILTKRTSANSNPLLNAGFKCCLADFFV